MDSVLPENLIDFGNYTTPLRPTTSRLSKTLERLRNFAPNDSERNARPNADKLETVCESVIEDKVWARLRIATHKMLDKAFDEWISDQNTPLKVQACLRLPSLSSDVFSQWANTKGLHLLDGKEKDLPQGTCVMTSLDPVIMRTPSGLQQLREYADMIDRHEGKVLLCGTTVQWNYICKVSSLDLLTNKVYQLPPYGAEALAELLSEEEDVPLNRDGKPRFRSRNSGKNIIEKKKGNLVDPFLTRVAADSQGCPWAALQLIDSSITRGPDRNGKLVNWVSDPEYPEVTGRYRREALFVLHAVMVHGALRLEDLELVMPYRPPEGLVSAMKQTGLIYEGGGCLHIASKFSAFTCEALSNSGFPLE